jgi:hypothetical protein
MVQGRALPNAWDLGLGSDTGLALQGWGLASADFNNDGYLDVLSAHGRATPDVDAPDVPQGQPDTLHLGGPGEGFQFSEQGSRFAASRAVVVFDVNNDGSLDTLLTRNNDAPQLLLNRGAHSGHWLGLRFRDRAGNVVGQGVQLRLVAGEATIDRIEVTWPDGKHTQHTLPALDQYWDIQQGAELAQEYQAAFTPRAPTDNKHRLYRRQFGDTYLRLLVRADESQEFLREVTGDDPTALAAGIGALPQRPVSRWLFLLERGLVAEDSAARTATLAVLQDWELEESVLRLLPLLGDDSPAVRCRTAGLFQHWFVEEEAAIHRKHLALTPLVRLLDAPDAESRVCAMGALAEAERFRGFHRLVELTDDEDVMVALTAVETLGRIRQREAIPVLEALAAASDDPDMQRAIERALELLASSGPPSHQTRSTTSHTPVEPPSPAVKSLLSLYQTPGAAAERQLLRQLATLDSAAEWRELLQGLPADQVRTRRVLMKAVFHKDAQIQRVAIQFSDQLLDEPKLADSLWRRVMSPALDRDVRLALMDKLGEHDPQRLLGMLDTIGPLL